MGPVTVGGINAYYIIDRYSVYKTAHIEPFLLAKEIIQISHILRILVQILTFRLNVILVLTKLTKCI